MTIVSLKPFNWYHAVANNSDNIVDLLHEYQERSDECIQIIPPVTCFTQQIENAFVSNLDHVKCAWVYIAVMLILVDLIKQIQLSKKFKVQSKTLHYPYQSCADAS